jgi:hypothetical protein
MAVTMTISVAMPMVVTPIIAIVPAIIMPVITISFITTVANYFLIMASPVVCVPCPDISIMHPWTLLIYYHFVSMIKVIIVVAIR